MLLGIEGWLVVRVIWGGEVWVLLEKIDVGVIGEGGCRQESV